MCTKSCSWVNRTVLWSKGTLKLCGYPAYPATVKLLAYVQGFIPGTGYSSDVCTDEHDFACAKFLSRNGG